MSQPFLGAIGIFPWDWAPRGWSLCQGQLLSIQQNQALFSLLGTTFGGNGTTTFALPDLRGRAPIHWGQGPGLSNVDLGEQHGVESVTLTVANLPSHNHSLAGSMEPGNTVSPAAGFPAVTEGLNYRSTGD